MTAADAPLDLRSELRTARMVWHRELIRFSRARVRIVTALVQPLLFLFGLGVGLNPLVGSRGGLNFTQFVFPGVVAMSVATTAIFSAVSIVWDREFGFLREMLVAPVSRTALVFGKVAGGATVATLQGAIMLALAPTVGVRLTPLTVLQVLGVALLMALALTAFGVFVASRIRRIEGFQAVMQLVLMPMVFLSGAVFPLRHLPAWLSVVTKLDPLTYAVDPLRRIVFAAQDVPGEVTGRFGTGVEIFGHTMSIASELAVVVVMTGVMLALSVRTFGRPD